MLNHPPHAKEPLEHLLEQKIQAEYESLQQIVRMDTTEFNHLVDHLLPELADLLRRTEHRSPRHLDWLVRRLVHEIAFSTASAPAAEDKSQQLMREFEVRVLLRATARAQQEERGAGLESERPCAVIGEQANRNIK